MVDRALTVTKCPSATQAETPEEADLKRVEAAPLCLKGRVERDEALPEVEMGMQGQGERKEGGVLQ